MIYRIFIGLVVVALLVGSFLLSRGPRDSDAPAAEEGAGPGPGYSARDAHIIETGADGTPLYTLHADLIEQPAGKEEVALTQVRMEFRDTDGASWTLRANTGELHEQATKIDLFGEVRAAGDLAVAGPVAGPAEITTEMLSFDTRTEILSTHAPVVLTWSGHELHAVGLLANLKDRHVRLESSVNGLFLP